jgi:PIN domain nuclease of toxin-antitoxin system
LLDASALLALLFEESGAAAVADSIAEGAAVSTVNLSEVAAVCRRLTVAHARSPALPAPSHRTQVSDA